MSETYVIRGGNELFGRVNLHGAKNAVLPMLAAALLTDEEVIIEDVPHITDIHNMVKLLAEVGAEVRQEDRKIRVRGQATKSQVSKELQKVMRSSMFMLGALLSAVGEVKMSLPGGCNIGARPLDIHLDGLRKLGAICEEKDGEFYCHATKLRGAKIVLRYPSVGATENLIIAAVKAVGKTTLINCAREPEIVSLVNLLKKMGVRISGEGTSVIEIEGVDSLGGATACPVIDRIVAGTLLSALSICGGEIAICGARSEHLSSTLFALKSKTFEVVDDGVYLRARAHKCAQNSHSSVDTACCDLTTGPYPLLPTDMQPMICASRCYIDAPTRIRETVFENRFSHLYEMRKLGADIDISGDVATIRRGQIHSGEVAAKDLRGGAGLTVFCLGAAGESRVSGVEYIRRGYENFDIMLRSLGADISVKTES